MHFLSVVHPNPGWWWAPLFFLLPVSPPQRAPLLPCCCRCCCCGGHIMHAMLHEMLVLPLFLPASAASYHQRVSFPPSLGFLAMVDSLAELLHCCRGGGSEALTAALTAALSEGARGQRHRRLFFLVELRIAEVHRWGEGQVTVMPVCRHRDIELPQNLGRTCHRRIAAVPSLHLLASFSPPCLFSSQCSFKMADLEQKAINTIRVLSADMVSKANSGHPGEIIWKHGRSSSPCTSLRA